MLLSCLATALLTCIFKLLHVCACKRMSPRTEIATVRAPTRDSEDKQQYMPDARNGRTKKTKTKKKKTQHLVIEYLPATLERFYISSHFCLRRTMRVIVCARCERVFFLCMFVALVSKQHLFCGALAQVRARKRIVIFRVHSTRAQRRVVGVRACTQCPARI